VTDNVAPHQEKPHPGDGHGLANDRGSVLTPASAAASPGRGAGSMSLNIRGNILTSRRATS
jgi:hypothetical protein